MMWRHMSGAGNTFLVGVADPQEPLPSIKGTGIEGILTLDHTEPHRFDASFYNPDGSFGMMCGNGSRCIVRFALDHGVQPLNGEIPFTLNGTNYSATQVSNSLISVSFPPPISERRYGVGELDGVDEEVYYVNVNSDHTVITGPLDATRPIVQQLRHHGEFPRGANVNMVELIEHNVVRIATFERGVEDITGACGTGAISSAIALWRAGKVDDHIMLFPPSGRVLEVNIQHNNTAITKVVLTGDARYDD